MRTKRQHHEFDYIILLLGTWVSCKTILGLWWKEGEKHYIQLSFLFMMRRMSRGKCYTAATTSSVMIDGWISTKRKTFPCNAATYGSCTWCGSLASNRSSKRFRRLGLYRRESIKRDPQTVQRYANLLSKHFWLYCLGPLHHERRWEVHIVWSFGQQSLCWRYCW